MGATIRSRSQATPTIIIGCGVYIGGLGQRLFLFHSGVAFVRRLFEEEYSMFGFTVTVLHPQHKELYYTLDTQPHAAFIAVLGFFMGPHNSIPAIYGIKST